MELPKEIKPKYFDEQYRLKHDLWIGAIEEVCVVNRIRFSDFHPYPDGSNLVASVDNEYVIKIFPPFHRDQWESEYRVLSALQESALDICVPGLRASGKRQDHWTYVVVEKLPGQTLESVWPKLSKSEKAEILSQIGTIMKKVHTVPIGQLSSLEPEWTSFIGRQTDSCADRLRRSNLPDWMLDELQEYVDSFRDFLPGSINPVILTGEYTPFNLLVEKHGGRWEITGMIDFGDAMVGFSEYDLLGPSLFLAEGKKDLVLSLVNSYANYDKQQLLSLRRRLMVMAILHRYSNLSFQLRIPQWQTKVKSIEELEQLIWPF